MRRSPLLFMLALVTSACAGTEKEPDTAGPICPMSTEEFCEAEFGGPCPTYDEATALFCDGVHLTTVDTGKPVLFSDGNTSCDNPQVSCNPESGVYTRLYFEADGSGRLEAIMADWPETEQCSSYRVFGDLWC